MSEAENSILRFVQLDQIPVALMAVLAAVIVIRLGSRFMDGVSERFTKHRLMVKQFTAVGRFAVVLSAALFAVGSVIQFSNQALLALGGTLAVAFGFAFKDLLASLMAGLILLFDRPFQVGDRITFDGYYGEVVEIGLRSVRLITLDDNVVSIPNNKFLTDIVSSANAGALHQMCVFHFYIGCNEDFEEAKAIVYDAAASSRYVFLDKPIRVEIKEGPVPNGAERFAIDIMLKAYVFDGRFETAFGTDVTERIKRAFRRKKIRTAGEIEWSLTDNEREQVSSK